MDSEDCMYNANDLGARLTAVMRCVHRWNSNGPEYGSIPWMNWEYGSYPNTHPHSRTDFKLVLLYRSLTMPMT
jgi:hypothetical protein